VFSYGEIIITDVKINLIKIITFLL